MPMRPIVRYRSRPNFRMLVPTYPYGTSPDMDNPVFNPPLLRKTITMSGWTTSSGGDKMGCMSSDIGYQHARLQVAYGGGDLVIEAGESLLRLGDYEIRPWVDYTPVGNNAALTAVALAAAVSNLPGFVGAHLGAGLIDIRTANQLDRIPIEVVNLHTFHHYTLTVEDAGYLLRVTSAGTVRHETPVIT